MPILTLAAIRANPWNVIGHTLPDNPDRLLLEAALLAADYCRTSERLILEAVRSGKHLPPGWTDTDQTDEAWYEAEQFYEFAHDIYREIHEAFFRPDEA